MRRRERGAAGRDADRGHRAAAPLAFVGTIARALRTGATVHLQLPIEGWGNSLVPGSALLLARLVTRKGRIAITLHEWTSLNVLRYLSTIPDLVASDGFVFVSPRQRDAFLSTPWAGAKKKAAAPVIPIGPNIMPAFIDPARAAQERASLLGEGAARADLVVGFFGVLYASKRPDLLLRAVAALHRRGVRARLLVCGDFLWDKPGDRTAFLGLARELGLGGWLDFRGRIDDEGELMATLSAADVFLLPYADGVSLRRGSFQAVSQLAIPLVTTRPEQADEFDAQPQAEGQDRERGDGAARARRGARGVRGGVDGGRGAAGGGVRRRAGLDLARGGGTASGVLRRAPRRADAGDLSRCAGGVTIRRQSSFQPLP